MEERKSTMKGIEMPVQKRLLIYFFYDKDGIVDRYVPYILEDMKKNVSEILIVINGTLTDDGRKSFEKITPHVLVRDNIGYDVWAYKCGLEHYGWDMLAVFDEVIMMNATIMGPLYPFAEMFEAMQNKRLDFWGLTLYHGAPFDPFGKIKYNFLPLHIQSHFIAVRRTLFSSKVFRNYWNDMPMITSYEESICWHEAIFTKGFSDRGFTWDVYIDTRDILQNSYCPLIYAPLQMIRDRRCPIIKRRSFFHDYTDFIHNTGGEITLEAVRYIREELDYDLDMVWENIIRLQNQADIKRINHLNYILPVNVIQSNEKVNKKVALIMHIYYTDLIEECYLYATAMPHYADIIVTTDSEEKKESILKYFSQIPCHKCKVILIENRGRDVASLLIGVKNEICYYDYICFAHDKKVTQLNFTVKGRSFAYKCFENLLPSRNFVENVIQTFEKHPRLGLLTPPPPVHAEYYPTIGVVDWGENFNQVVKLAESLGINVNLDKGKEPIAPLGTMFWFRSCALKKLLDKDWKYEDFPLEPNKSDGTLLHAIERLYPFIVQDAGYYPAWLLSDRYAAIEITNLYFMLREMNKAAFQIYGTNTSYDLISTMNNMMNVNRENHEKEIYNILRKLIKQKIKMILPGAIWEFLKKIHYGIQKSKKRR
jgi:rhamnosyltransferase